MAAALDAGGNDADDGLWLSAFLAPWGVARPAGAAPQQVRMIRSDAAATRLERLAGQWRDTFACFGLDTCTVALPGRRTARALWLADAEARCFYRIRGARIDVIAHRGARRARLGLMRIVREALIARLLEDGRLLDLHAAAFSLSGQGVLIAGRKRAGKTSLLSHALHSAGAALVANDRVLLDTRPEPAVSGVPTVISVRPGTIRFFPQLRRPQAEPPALRHGGETPRADPAAPPPPNLLLAPWQLAQAFAAPQVARAPLAAILFPQIDETAGGVELQRLPVDVARARLADSLYGAATRGDVTVLGAWAGACGAGGGADLAALAARVPMYDCRVGPTAYQAPAGRWLQALGMATSGGGAP